VDDGFVVFKLDNLAVKGGPNPGPRQLPRIVTSQEWLKFVILYDVVVFPVVL
jgi:hypothetical protein